MNSRNELNALLGRYLEGEATASDMAKLNDLLRSDPQARRQFAEHLNLDSALSVCAADWEAHARERESPAALPAKRRIVPFPARHPWLAAACAALLAGGAWWWHQTQQTYATVTNDAGIEDLSNGTALRGEGHEIKAGMVEFITARGARVVIEAPASFRFESAQRLHLMHGRVAADVPPAAKGFTVVTPAGDAVDLGTKFGVDVPREGTPEIHVFQGEVIARPKSGGKHQSLRDGEAFSLEPGSGKSRDFRSSAFIRPDEVASLQAGLAAGQRARSEAAMKKLRDDPALIALLDFEPGEEHEGTFRAVQGRWPGSHAAEFVNVGDRLKLNVGGGRDWPQLSMAAWVRVDRLGEPYQSLYHTDGWDDRNPGQLHWMINRDTTMRLALQQNTLAPGVSERHGFPDSRTPVLPERGRWVHLAFVYDSALRTTRFFLNGTFDKEVLLGIANPARLGPAQIGNWDSKDRKLSGRMDELLILGRALNDEEVRTLHDAGNPYR